MGRKSKPNRPTNGRFTNAFRVLIVAASIALLLALAAATLSVYNRLPELRRRVDYVPVRIHMLLVERKRQRHPPAVPTPVLSTPSTGPPPVQPIPALSLSASPDHTGAVQASGPTTFPSASLGRTAIPTIVIPVLSPSPTSTAPPTFSATSTAVPTLTPTSTQAPVHKAITLNGVRHVWQDWNNCGPATLSMVLSYYGHSETQQDVATVVKPNKWDLNVSPWELAAYPRSLELEALVREGGRIGLIKAFLDHRIPVMLEMWYYPDEHGGGHYRMIVGYDEATEEWIAYDVQLGPGYRVSFGQQDEEWQVLNRLYIVVYRPEQESIVHDIVGDEMDDVVMYQRALEVALAERETDPDDPYAWFNVGTNHAALGNHREASEAYDQARILGLPFRMLWYQFGPFEAYMAQGRYRDVIDLATANLEMVGNQEESHTYLGRAKQALGEVEAARRCYQEALEYHPGFPPAAEALASLE
jgi:tetratricopeptide (TPR) repeat protein